MTVDPEAVQLPWLEVADTSATFAGSVSVTVVPVDTVGPAFVAVNVYVMLEPAGTVPVGPAPTSERSVLPAPATIAIPEVEVAAGTGIGEPAVLVESATGTTVLAVLLVTYASLPSGVILTLVSDEVDGAIGIGVPATPVAMLIGTSPPAPFVT